MPLIIVGKKTVPLEIFFFFAPRCNFQEREFIGKGGLSMLRKSPAQSRTVCYSEYGCGRLLQDVADLFRTGHGHIVEDGDVHCCRGYIPCC